MNITTRTIELDGIEMFLNEAGDEGPLVVLSHGFPELGYSWRHQLPALAEAGYRVVAPDQRGYGRTTAPTELDDYDIVHLTDDLLALLDHFDEETATFVGHDWGALVVWQMALMHPDRMSGVCGMSVPFARRPSGPPVQIMRSVFADSFFYMVYFQEPGVADAELGANPATTMRRMLCGVNMAAENPGFSANDGRGFIERMPEPDSLPNWLSQSEVDHYVSEFERTGFTGGLNWYRNLDRNWELTEHLSGKHVEIPSLFIGGTNDPVLSMTDPQGQTEWLDDHRGSIIVDGAGHWVQQESPDEVNTALLDFLNDIREREPQ